MSSTIVIIEDNPNSARMAEKLLRKGGYDVYVAEDGETGYDTVAEHQPGLVLVDLGLPDIDGQTVIAMLRQEIETEQPIILAFTAYPPDTAREMAEAYGCDGVISKPIDTRTFVAQIESYLVPSAANATGIEPEG